MVDQNLPSNSVLENAINGDSSKTKNNVSVGKALFRENARIGIIDELIDDCILEICFEIHRAEKISLRDKNKSEKPKIPEAKIPEANSEQSVVPNNTQRRANDQITVQCYICSVKLSAEKLCSHLEVCMGISSKRKATQKIGSFTEFDSESSDSEGRPSSVKRKKKGNGRGKQTKRQGNSSKQSSDNGLNYKDMSKDEVIAFFFQHCGVILKRSKLPCKMSINCSRHSEEERKLVRFNILSVMNETVTSDEVVDIDTIDEGIGSEMQPFTMPSLTDAE